MSKQHSILKLSLFFYSISIAFAVQVHAEAERNSWSYLLSEIQSNLEQAKQNIWNEIEPD